MSGPVKALSAKEADILTQFIRYDHTTAVEHIAAIRNQTIAVLMLDAGLRVGEVIQLVRNDLYMAAAAVQSLTVREDIAKGHRRRDVPMSLRLQLYIREMAEKIWYGVNGTDFAYAFRGSKPGSHITSRQVERIISKAGQVSLGFPVHPHMLRHTFATLLMAKTNIRVVQQLLGHQSLQSTQVYTHPNSVDLRNAIDSLHPSTDEQ